MIFQVEDAGEARAREKGLFPVAGFLLCCEQKTDSAPNRVGRKVAGGKQAEQGPGGLAGGAGAEAPEVRGIGGITTLPPAAVRVLIGANPLGSPLAETLAHVHAYACQTAQSEAGPVNIIDAPASIPGPVRLLLPRQELHRAADRE